MHESSSPEEKIERALIRIRRSQQARRLQQRSPDPLADGARYRCLDVLDELRGLTISDIAEAIGVDRPRASRLANELLADRLVYRERAPIDLRYAMIRLTGEGKDTVDAMHANRRRAVAEALADFTPDEAETLAALLTRFLDAWPAGDATPHPSGGRLNTGS
jgi:DNA-binding MarR family transcriptional regulator